MTSKETRPTQRSTQAKYSQRAVRTIAVVEAIKGIVVLLAATGLLALVHEDLNDLAARLVQHLHLNPASRYPHIFLDAVSHVQEPRMLWLALGAALYAAIRLVEACGLYWGRAWAEWLAALSGAFYVPLEIRELVHVPSRLTLLVLVINVAVVAVMICALIQRRIPHADKTA